MFEAVDFARQEEDAYDGHALLLDPAAFPELNFPEVEGRDVQVLNLTGEVQDLAMTLSTVTEHPIVRHQGDEEALFLCVQRRSYSLRELESGQFEVVQDEDGDEEGIFVLGFTHVKVDSSEVYVKWTFVAPKEQGNGYGRLLFDALGTSYGHLPVRRKVLNDAAEIQHMLVQAGAVKTGDGFWVITPSQ